MANKASQQFDKITDEVADTEVSDEKAKNAMASLKSVQKRYIPGIVYHF
jgi:hypothetical protein